MVNALLYLHACIFSLHKHTLFFRTTWKEIVDLMTLHPKTTARLFLRIRTLFIATITSQPQDLTLIEKHLIYMPYSNFPIFQCLCFSPQSRSQVRNTCCISCQVSLVSFNLEQQSPIFFVFLRLLFLKSLDQFSHNIYRSLDCGAISS